MARLRPNTVSKTHLRRFDGRDDSAEVIYRIMTPRVTKAQRGSGRDGEDVKQERNERAVRHQSAPTSCVAAGSALGYQEPNPAKILNSVFLD